MGEKMKLDFGAGNNPKEGFESVDLYTDAKHKVDLMVFPFPWEDGSVEEIHCSHFLEHVPQEKRWPFFAECYRVLKTGSKMHIAVPNWKSERGYGDMTHEWPPVTAMSFYYLNKGWREINKLTYGPYDIKCDFDFNIGASGINAPFATRSYEVQVFATTHYMESYQDMWVILTKK